jgi:hypothetical protein
MLSGMFPSSVRERGFQYFRQHRVTVLSGSSSELRAEVLGSEMYDVTLTYSKKGFEMSCDCPFFFDRDQYCKHMWAAIATADEQDYLSDARAALDLRQTVKPVQPPPPPGWKMQLGRIALNAATPKTLPPAWPAGAEIVYLIDVAKSRGAGTVVVTIARREPSKTGGRMNAPKPYVIDHDRVAGLPVEEDRALLGALVGGVAYNAYGYYEPKDRGSSAFIVSAAIAQALVPKIVGTGRCFLSSDSEDRSSQPLAWDDGEPWRFLMTVRGTEADGWQLEGMVRRGEEQMPVADLVLETKDGFLMTRERVARLLTDRGFPWIRDLREHGSITVAEQDREEFFTSLLNSPALPALELPELWEYQEVMAAPRKWLRIDQPQHRYKTEPFPATLAFEYEGHAVGEREKASGFYDAQGRRFLRRDDAAEKAAVAELLALGLRFQPPSYGEDARWTVTPAKIPRVVRGLVEAGWLVSADGRAFRQPGEFTASVSSGVDWFELQGGVRYGDTVAPLPQLLAALKRGDTMVTLADGSWGMLPEELLRRFSAVAAMGDEHGDHIRFRPSQAGVLDALLATQPAVNCDEAFRRVRVELERFQAIGMAEQPAGFRGRLRDYQREGLAWMHFLRQFSFGGCLADDMGVGKTAQVLALLETRRELRVKGEIEAPSLVVVPKSLIFNWKQEVERFTPEIRVLDYTGVARNKGALAGYDVILTTYGTLRKDVVHFKDQVFDYVILDESQAVKNAKTDSAKAVRLLRGNHRLAMSGTPVENHLGELWSLLEFLNPGMLGSFGAFQVVGGAMRDAGEDARKLLAHALRPFLLRRTKEQVAKELPAKIEQTIYCEMEAQQKTLYDGLRDHYRDSLLRKIDRDGVGKSKIQVLTALLRLRQAACHPGLIDRKRMQEPSAKLDVLLEQLRAVLEEGHKALVFSQFTSLLAIVRSRLDAEGVTYEYLDGKTVKREACVERFQNDAECRLFLISLKAGGVGLNLTAADYVFILDPWWNPAVEAQAVDRTHRIGQVRQVFAYRLITRDTVEEKVLQLQESKRQLADAIIGEENGLIRELRAEDIALLLS